MNLGRSVLGSTACLARDRPRDHRQSLRQAGRVLKVLGVRAGVDGSRQGVRHTPGPPGVALAGRDVRNVAALDRRVVPRDASRQSLAVAGHPRRRNPYRLRRLLANGPRSLDVHDTGAVERITPQVGYLLQRNDGERVEHGVANDDDVARAELLHVQCDRGVDAEQRRLVGGIVVDRLLLLRQAVHPHTAPKDVAVPELGATCVQRVLLGHESQSLAHGLYFRQGHSSIMEDRVPSSLLQHPSQGLRQVLYAVGLGIKAIPVRSHCSSPPGSRVVHRLYRPGVHTLCRRARRTPHPGLSRSSK